MAVEGEAGADAGAEVSFEQEMEAARTADAGAEAGAVEGGEVEGGEPEEAAADKRPPLPPEEIARRLEDQKLATRSERQKRRELEQTLRSVQERLTAFEQGGGKAQGAAPALGERPNPTEDPIGYLEYVEAIVAANAEQEAAAAQQQEAQQRAQAETQQIVSKVGEYEADFREMQPDYDQAAEHLYGVKMAEYADSGYDQQEAHAMVMGEFLTRSKRALAAGKDPAEIVYNLAKRAGYGAKAGEGKLETIERGQRAGSPLSSAGGRPAGDLTFESVARLNGAAFDTAFAKLRERAQAVERASGI